jgi:outer membrane protein assembly factor BamB
MKRLIRWCWIVTCLSTAASLKAPSCAATEADEILQAAGFHGGLIVQLGCGDARLTAALAANQRAVVQGLDLDPVKVAAARAHLRSLGQFGRVSADRFDGTHLPYVDNLVNLVVAEQLGKVSMQEVLRVLAPGGIACVRSDGTWHKTSKPWPKDIDQWTHYLHGADNNAVAHDTVVGAPRHVQWLAAPIWTRNHHALNSISAVVTAQGRLFYILDEAAAANINLPSKWAIVARDAFSGITLWQKPLPSWSWQQIRFRSGPPQLPRLLVACDDRLYAPLGLSAAVSALDATTGETVQTFQDTQGAEEIVLAGRTLLVLAGRPVAEQAFNHPFFEKQYRLPNEKSLVAIDTSTGKTLWRWSDAKVHPLAETLASDGKQAYLQIDEGVVCFDLQSGKKQWRYEEPAEKREKSRKKAVSYGEHTLVVADDVVLCNLAGNLTALGARDGKQLWQCQAGGGFHSPLDLFVIGGLVWQGCHPKDSVAPPPEQDFNEGRDLHTGEIKVTNAVAVDLQTAGHHHRCYREKATDRFIIMGKRGIELMDLVASDHSRNNWVRGTCQYGILPANGLLYAPPHSCGCYMESKLRGFWALAADGRQRTATTARIAEEARLEKGPAYGTLAPRRAASAADDWPVYRHDALRRGVATTSVPDQLQPSWQTPLGEKLTQPVVAEDRVVVAGVDEGVVYALDEKSGKVVWTHLSGGRIDSPPAIYRGMVLFGSADGRVNCLRLSDGQLVWRFLAAAAELRTVAFDRVESVWPVHGSVLLLGDVLYCSAGRSTWLDGGIDLYALEPASGKTLCKAHFESRHPQFQEGKDQAREDQETRVTQNLTDYRTFLAPDRSDAFSMAGGAVSDVLVSDGTNVFLHQAKFNAKLQQQEPLSRHLFSTSSLLEDTENHRTHWVLGTGDFSRMPVAYSWIVDSPKKQSPTVAVPAATMMVYDDQAVWGVRNQGNANGKYELFQKENRPFSAQEKSLPDFRPLGADEIDRCVYKSTLTVRPSALLKSGSSLFLAVVPTEIPADDPHAAYEGRRGAALWVCSGKDGSQRAQYALPSPVVWDGLAAAHGRLYFSTQDGQIACFAQRDH